MANPATETQNPETDSSGANPGTDAPSASADSASAAPADPAPAPETPTAPEPRVLTIPTAKMGEIKRAERDRGRTEVRAELDSTAKELGYASHDDMVAKLREQKAQRLTSPQAPAPAADVDDFDADPVDPTPTPADDLRSAEQPRVAQRLERENQKLLEDRKKLNRARAHQERKAKDLEQRLDAQQAEHALRFAAVRAGISDDGHIEFAIHTLRRQLKGKTADELASFNENTFFKDELRSSHPYLYATTVSDAHSSPEPEGTGANGGTPPPGDTQEQSGGAPDAQTDARTMSKDAFAKLLRSRGLTDPSVGMPT